MLKRKSKLNYRRGYTWKNCGDCDHFRPNSPLKGIGSAALPPDDRCTVIGLQPGRMYHIHRKNICDRFDDSLQVQHREEMLVHREQAPEAAA